MKKLVVSILLLIIGISCLSITSASSQSENLIAIPTDFDIKLDEISPDHTKQDMIDECVAEELFVSSGFSQQDKRKEIVLKVNNSENSKDYIFDRMLNSIDYFNTLKATYCYETSNKPDYYSTYCIELDDEPKSKELIYEDSGALLTENIFDGTYYTKLDLLDDSNIKKQVSSYKIKSVSQKDICKSMISDRNNISLEELSKESSISKNYIDLKSNKELDYVAMVASKSRIQYLPETQNNTYYYRDNLPMLSKSNIQYFPQDFAFGFLSDFDKWNVDRIETYLGRKCFVINGEISGFYSEKMDTKTFEMWVDKEIGALLTLKGYDENNEISVQLTTYEFVVDESIDQSVFDDLSNL